MTYQDDEKPLVWRRPWLALALVLTGYLGLSALFALETLWLGGPLIFWGDSGLSPCTGEGEVARFQVFKVVNLAAIALCVGALPYLSLRLFSNQGNDLEILKPYIVLRSAVFLTAWWPFGLPSIKIPGTQIVIDYLAIVLVMAVLLSWLQFQRIFCRNSDSPRFNLACRILLLVEPILIGAIINVFVTWLEVVTCP